MDQFTIPACCGQIVSEKRYDFLKDFLDNFVIIIDSPRQRCINFVPDILGVRPMFVGKANSRIVEGLQLGGLLLETTVLCLELFPSTSWDDRGSDPLL